jgi:hypothetical protein
MNDDVAPDSSQPTARRPAVFLFQPRRFRRVTPERLEEWENTVRKQFGMSESELIFDDQRVLNGGSWSDSGPNGQICPDDSDDFGDEPTTYSGDEVVSSTGRRPAVFILQPDTFAPVASEQLAEWEQIMREHVGLTAGQVAREGGSGTLSATLPNDCIDDSDYASE